MRVEKGSPVWNKEGKPSPLRGHLRGAPFALSWAVGWKNGRRSRRGKHHAGGRFVPNVFMKDSLIKGGKNVCWFPMSFLSLFPPSFRFSTLQASALCASNHSTYKTYMCLLLKVSQADLPFWMRGGGFTCRWEHLRWWVCRLERDIWVVFTVNCQSYASLFIWLSLVELLYVKKQYEAVTQIYICFLHKALCHLADELCFLVFFSYFCCSDVSYPHGF